MGAVTAAYTRRRPEETTLYAVVRDNLATLYGAVEDGALPISLPAFVRKELDGYLECGMLCRGFARLRCDGCEETRIVAFSCKGRGFCPSCLGRKMAQTAAHLVEDVLPPVALRQWVLTFPYAWRKRLGYDAALLSALTGIFLKTVLGFYRKKSGGAQAGGKSGAVVSVQRTSSDLKLNPHLHAVFLDGAYKEDVAPPSTSSSEDALDAVPRFLGLGHLQTREVAEVLGVRSRGCFATASAGCSLRATGTRPKTTNKVRRAKRHAGTQSLWPYASYRMLRSCGRRQGRLRCRYSASPSEPLQWTSNALSV
jgi:Transposase zinc-binding domain/Putative transposase